MVVTKIDMRILYLAEAPAYSSGGVLRKIKSQYETWLEMGQDAKLVLLSPRLSGQEKPAIEGPGISVVGYRAARFGGSKIFKAFALRVVENIVRQYRPDVIYYRQSSWTPGIISILKMAKGVVVEVNSNDVYEIGQYGWFVARYHLVTRKWLIDLARGFVCVGRDIGEYYCRYGKPVVVVSNGFDTSKVIPRAVPYNDKVNFVFVGSPGQSWHGVDKILEVAELLPDYEFHIVGDRFDVSHKNVHCYGYLDWERLDELYRTMDIGLASLALHRINIDEISPLKTREYLAYGLPIITAYEDIDLDGCDFVLRLPNSESGVRDSLIEIKRFAEFWKDKNIDMNIVRSRIDYRVKEGRRLAFINNSVAHCV